MTKTTPIESRFECECGAIFTTPEALQACVAAEHDNAAAGIRPAPAWLYRESEKPGELGSAGLWTVGFFRTNGEWIPESDQPSPELAAARVNYLNGRGLRHWISASVRNADRDALEELVDALDHISKVCRGSRTQSRRIRWIAARAECAIGGSRDWRELDIPSADPIVQGLQGAVRLVVPYIDQAIADIEADHETEAPVGELATELGAYKAFVKAVNKYARLVLLDSRRAAS